MKENIGYSNNKFGYWQLYLYAILFSFVNNFMNKQKQNLYIFRYR